MKTAQLLAAIWSRLDRGALWLLLWFVLNVAVTITNKALLSSFGFPFPSVVSGIHLLVTWWGASAAHWLWGTSEADTLVGGGAARRLASSNSLTSQRSQKSGGTGSQALIDSPDSLHRIRVRTPQAVAASVLPDPLLDPHNPDLTSPVVPLAVPPALSSPVAAARRSLGSADSAEATTAATAAAAAGKSSASAPTTPTRPDFALADAMPAQPSPASPVPPVVAMAAVVGATVVTGAPLAGVEAGRSDDEDAAADSWGLLLYSVLFAANIYMGNAALWLSSLTAVQLARSAIPAFTALFSSGLGLVTASSAQLAAAGVVVAGAFAAALTAEGERPREALASVASGAALAVCLLSALKSVCTASLLGAGQKRRPPMRALADTARMAAVWLLSYAAMQGELHAAVDRLLALDDRRRVLVLLLNALMACALNVASFRASAAGVTPLSITIAGNVKHAVTIALGPLFGVGALPSPLRALGIVATLAGACAYAFL